MRLVGLTTLCLILAFVCADILAVNLETVVTPSEDEVDELYRLGEIDYQQYLLLKEIAIHGIDSSTVFLLDEIPNLAHFLRDTSSLSVPLEKRQESSFISSNRHQSQARAVHGRLKHTYQVRLEDDRASRYRTFGDFRLRDQWRLTFRLNRDVSGPERFVGRALTYKSKQGTLRRITLGTYSARLGLGTAFGYRGSLLDYSEKISAESFMYPDYGGYNGLYLVTRIGRFETKTLVSVVRDSQHRISSLATSLTSVQGSIRPGVVVGTNRVRNRKTGLAIDIPVFAFNGMYRYKTGYVRAEVSRQTGRHSDALSAVIEGRHRFDMAETKYAGWAYADDYLDITGGSKSGNLSHAQHLDEVDLDITSRRPGQEGFLLRTIVLLADKLDLFSSFLRASFNSDFVNTQSSGGLNWKANPATEFQLDYLGRWKKRLKGTAIDTEGKHRIRLEGRFKPGNLEWRGYIAFNMEKTGRDYASIFANVKSSIPRKGKLEIWSRSDWYSSEGMGYWYAFLRAEQLLGGGLFGSIKFMHTYDRDATDQSVAAVSIGLSAAL
ncbi:MAG: hypothetical protein DRP45_06605 [Candidatus Zixiibacteriota bacterium]|nr:MAG: hypothetical protein DRP45_06605 [candidate division Zixibacteria bacterium]